jgi:hypothetical protein
MIGDGTIISILLDQGDFYIFPDQMSAYRIIRRHDADNAVSIMSRQPLEYTKSVLNYAHMLEDFFKGKYNFVHIKRVGIDFSINNSIKLHKAEKQELREIISGLGIYERLYCYFRYFKTKARQYILYIPKKILR